MSVRIKLTMSGSIGSGSVPVGPSTVGDGAAVEVGEDAEVELVPEANARPPVPANSTRNRANASLRALCLNMRESPFPAQMCAGAETRDCERGIRPILLARCSCAIAERSR